MMRLPFWSVIVSVMSYLPAGAVAGTVDVVEMVLAPAAQGQGELPSTAVHRSLVECDTGKPLYTVLT